MTNLINRPRNPLHTTPKQLPDPAVVFDPIIRLAGYYEHREIVDDRYGYRNFIKVLRTLGQRDRDGLVATCDWVLGKGHHESVDDVLAWIQPSKPILIGRQLPDGTQITVSSQRPRR